MTPPQSPEDSGQQTDLKKAITVLRRRAWLIALCVVVAAAAAFGFSKLQDKQYSASASLLFRNPGFAEDLFGSTPTGSGLNATREAATNQKLVGLRIVGARAAKLLPGLSAEQVSSMVTASPAGESELVSVTATSPDPRQAARVANTFARQFIAFRAGTEREKLQQAKRLAEREFFRLSPEQQAGARGQALSRGAEKLGILASLQTGNAELVQPAGVPSSPSSPKPGRNTVLGAVLGLLLGLILAFVLERLNRRLRNPEEVKAAMGPPLLGTIPESKAISEMQPGTLDTALPFSVNEAFRMLRASLRYFNVDHKVRTVLVAADDSGVGKSTVTWNLGRIAASSTSVVVVEADLRNPSFERRDGALPRPGLAEFLTNQAGLDEVIQHRPLPAEAQPGAEGERSIDVITAGASPPNPADLLESHVMADLLETLGQRYELVLVDTAPLAVVSDALPLLAHVDGVLVVVRMGKTSRDGVAGLTEQLGRFDAPILGVIANAVKQGRRQKYGYGYGYYGDDDGGKPASSAGGELAGTTRS